MKTLFAVVMATSILFAVSYPEPEEGSKIDSKLIQVKVELVKDDNSTVTLLDGNEYVEIKSDSNATAISDTIHKNLPESGIYIGVRYTVNKIKTKAQIVLAGTTYYTLDTSVNSGESWDLSTDPTKKDYTTMTPSFTDENYVKFTKPLVISNADATIYSVSKFSKNIQLEWTDFAPEHIHWIGEEQIFTGILSQEPKKEINFDINYTKGSSWKSNKLTILTDGNYSILGAHMSRPSMYALNGSFFKDGKDTEGGYEIDIHKADNSNSFFRINVDINCSGGTYTLNYLYLHPTENTNTNPGIVSDEGYTLNTNGSVQCKDITY